MLHLVRFAFASSTFVGNRAHRGVGGAILFQFQADSMVVRQQISKMAT